MQPDSMKIFYLGISRTNKRGKAAHEALEIHSWDQMEGIYEKDIETSLLIIPVGPRLRALAARLEPKEE